LPELLVYGAYGYTGRLVVARLVDLGHRPIVAGRDESQTREIARDFGLEHRIFGLEIPSPLDACLEGVSAVIHCAGPFVRTAHPMVDACLRTRTHYLDITGEVAVFESLSARSDEAKQRGVMLLPGVGFDVVPSDCLAVHVARRITSPTVLRLAILGIGSRLSHGTALTMVENLHRGGLIRNGGRLETIGAGTLTRRFDFGRGPRLSMAVPWGDLSTAWRSTGIARIETYFASRRTTVWGARAMGAMPWLIRSGPIQGVLKRRIDARPAGPGEAERERGRSIILAEVENASGQRAASRLETMEGYKLTAHAASHIGTLVASGRFLPGFQTPAMVFGPDLVLEFERTHRVDLD